MPLFMPAAIVATHQSFTIKMVFPSPEAARSFSEDPTQALNEALQISGRNIDRRLLFNTLKKYREPEFGGEAGETVWLYLESDVFACCRPWGILLDVFSSLVHAQVDTWGLSTKIRILPAGKAPLTVDIMMTAKRSWFDGLLQEKVTEKKVSYPRSPDYSEPPAFS